MFKSNENHKIFGFSNFFSKNVRSKKNFLWNLRLKLQIIQFASNFSEYFWSKKSFLVSNWNVGWFELSFDVDIVYVNQKIVNILHFCSKSSKIFSVEMGLLWLDLMKILWNIG